MYFLSFSCHVIQDKKRERILFGASFQTRFYLFVLEPGEGLRGEDEPVVTRAALHDAQVGDGHPAAPDHLVAQLTARLVRVLRGVLRAAL